MTNLPRSVLSLSAVLVIAFLSGCATSGPTVQSLPDTAVRYENYKTFAMVFTSNLPAASNPAISPSLVRQIREETEAGLLAKGLAKAPRLSADLLVYLRGGLQQKTDIDDAAFVGPRFGGRGYAIDQYQEGTILVDIVDARTRELVWRGSIVGEVDGPLKPDAIKAAVNTVVARYPN